MDKNRLKKIWAITLIEKIELKNNKINFGKTFFCGYYVNKVSAVESIKEQCNNYGELYRYIALEEIAEGINNKVNETIWFEYNTNINQYNQLTINNNSINILPLLENGVFVKVVNTADNYIPVDNLLGVIINKNVIYNGDYGWDSVDKLNRDNVINDIVAIWDKDIGGFINCKDDNALWVKEF